MADVSQRYFHRGRPLPGAASATRILFVSSVLPNRRNGDGAPAASLSEHPVSWLSIRAQVTAWAIRLSAAICVAPVNVGPS